MLSKNKKDSISYILKYFKNYTKNNNVQWKFLQMIIIRI